MEGIQLKNYIQSTYVDKIIAYIQGRSPTIATSKEYIRLYNFIIEQCDFGDNSANLYEYLVETNTSFLRNVILPRITSLPSWV